MLHPETDKVIDSNNLKVHPRVKELYKFFKYNNKVVDILDYNKEDMRIYSRDVLELINLGKTGWEDMLPEGVSRLIKEQKLFGYHAEPQKALD